MVKKIIDLRRWQVMSDNQTFEQSIAQCNEIRNRDWWKEHNKSKLNGEYIYSEFSLWCKAYNEDRANAYAFAKFLKEQGIELTFGQRKYLAEKYFGYKYEYDYDKKDWEIKKV